MVKYFRGKNLTVRLQWKLRTHTHYLSILNNNKNTHNNNNNKKRHIIIIFACIEHSPVYNNFSHGHHTTNACAIFQNASRLKRNPNNNKIQWGQVQSRITKSLAYKCWASAHNKKSIAYEIIYIEILGPARIFSNVQNGHLRWWNIISFCPANYSRICGRIHCARGDSPLEVRVQGRSTEWHFYVESDVTVLNCITINGESPYFLINL